MDQSRTTLSRRRFLAALGLLGGASVGAALTGCAPAPAPTPPQPPAKPPEKEAAAPTQAPAKPVQREKVSVRLDWLVTGYHAPFFVGLDKGIFADNGLDVTVQEGRGSVGTIQAVAAGQDTFGMADATVLPKAVQQGADIKMITGYQQVNSSAVMFFKDSGIKTPKDLEGKRYGDVPGGAQSLLFPAFLKAAGVDRNKITVLTTDAANKDRGFVARQYDATLTQLNDSFVKLKFQGHDLGAFAYADYGVNVLAHGLIASGKTLKEKPDIVRRFVKSWLRAVEVTRQNPAEAAKISKRMNEQAPAEEVQIEMLKEAFARLATKNTQGKPTGWMAEADWKEMIDLLREYGALDQPVAPGLLFTNEFLPA